MHGIGFGLPVPALLLWGSASGAWAAQAQERIDDTLTSTAPAAQREAISAAALRTLRYIGY